MGYQVSTVSKEVRLFLLQLSDEISEDITNLSSLDKKSVEYQATKELVRVLRKAAHAYRYAPAQSKKKSV